MQCDTKHVYPCPPQNYLGYVAAGVNCPVERFECFKENTNQCNINYSQFEGNSKLCTEGFGFVPQYSTEVT